MAQTARTGSRDVAHALGPATVSGTHRWATRGVGGLSFGLLDARIASAKLARIAAIFRRVVGMGSELFLQTGARTQRQRKSRANALFRNWYRYNAIAAAALRHTRETRERVTTNIPDTRTSMKRVESAIHTIRGCG